MAKKKDANQDAIIEKLAELGGGRPSSDDIERHDGRTIVLPGEMATKQAISMLKDHMEREEQQTVFDRTFRHRFLDVAVATDRGLKKVFGMTGKPVESFFGPPPQLRTVEIGPGETAQTPIGEIECPALEGTMFITEEEHEEFGALGKVMFYVPRKFRATVEGVFRVIEDELRERSIYRGKALEGPEGFMDLQGVAPERIVYPPETMRQLSANIWASIVHTDTMRAAGLPIKRSVLLHSGYGYGKTEAARLTAKLCEENGWTFVYVRPNRDDLGEMMALARLYAPAVVFFEDADTLDGKLDGDGISKLLDDFDGLSSKGAELVAILTTNHPERIHKGMLRAGRLDAVIRFEDFGPTEIERLVRVLVPEGKLDAATDFAAVGEAMTGMAPAFIVEAVHRASRYVIDRTGDVGPVSTEDLVGAASGMGAHLDLMAGADDAQRVTPTIDRAVRETVANAVGLDGASLSRPDSTEPMLKVSANGKG